MYKEEKSKKQGASADWTKTAIMADCTDYGQGYKTTAVKRCDDETGLPDLKAARGKTNYRTLASV